MYDRAALQSPLSIAFGMSYQAVLSGEHIDGATAKSYHLTSTFEKREDFSENDASQHLQPSTWRRLWKTPATMGVLFLFGEYYLI